MDGEVNFLSQRMDKHCNTATVESLYLYLALMSVFYGFLCCNLACSVAEIWAVYVVNRRVTEAVHWPGQHLKGLGPLVLLNGWKSQDWQTIIVKIEC